jgi:UDP-N-acetylglucosamine acyltransferase
LTVGQRPTAAHGLNSVGLKRKGVPKDTVRALKDCYAKLFRSKLVLKDAMEEVERDLGDVEEVRYLLEFVRSSERGVHR